MQALLLKQNPSDLLIEINALMDAGEETKASAALDQYLTVNDYSAWQWYRSACLQAYLDDRDSWQKQCLKLIEQFRDSDDLLTLNRVGKACLLMDDPSEEFQQEARRSIARANVLFPNEFWIAVSQALLSHHKGIQEETIAAARRALTFEKRAPDADVCLYSLMAMSAFRLGDKETAEASLTQAGKIREEKFPQLNGKPMGSAWPNILVAEILHRKARRIILGETESTREAAEEEPQSATPEKEKAASE